MKRLLWLLMLLLTGCSGPLAVETLHPQRGPLEDSFSEEAITRLAQTWVVSTPADGRLERLTLEPGDRVRRGQVLVGFDRLPAELAHREASQSGQEQQERWRLARGLQVEEAAVRQAGARLREAEALLGSWAAREAQARTRARQAAIELARSRTLFEQDAIPRQRLENDQVAASTAGQVVLELQAQGRAQRAAVESAREALGQALAQRQRRLAESLVAREQWDQAQTRQARSAHEASQQWIRSPVAGVVLERFEQGPGWFPAGTRLLRLGDPARLEALAEVLTEDALRLKVGLPVRLEPAAGLAPVAGQVARIEPAGFTKLSSLGVEQRRVNVIIRFPSRPPDWGVGYRLRARFVVGERREVLLVPRSAVLQKPDRSYYVLKVVEERLREQPIELGLKGDLELEVKAGLAESDLLVALPETSMREGERVTPR